MVTAEDIECTEDYYDALLRFHSFQKIGKALTDRTLYRYYTLEILAFATE
jgi:hypothetical protein